MAYFELVQYFRGPSPWARLPEFLFRLLELARRGEGKQKRLNQEVSLPEMSTSPSMEVRSCFTGSWLSPRSRMTSGGALLLTALS